MPQDAPHHAARRITHHAWLAQEPFTLALSAGFFGFFAHAGLLRAFERAGVRPARIVGVSAGALAGGVVACGVPVAQLEETLLTLRREDFWDAGWPLGGLLKGQKFARKLADLIAPTGVLDLADCPTRFCPVVHDILRRVPVALERGCVVDGIRASCALPGLFRPVQIGSRWYVDGGVRDRPGISAVAPDERVLVHNLVSKSPWRHFFPPPQGGRHGNRQWLDGNDYPRVTPFALHQGGLALQAAYEVTRRWLDAPVAGAD